MSTPNPPQAPAIFWLIWLYVAITSIVWQVRNPTANLMTFYTRLPHVLAYDKLAEYQVVETHVSIGTQTPQTMPTAQSTVTNTPSL